VRYLATFLLVVLPWVAMVAAEEEKRTSEKQVNLNTATAAELASLPGIGEAIAARIIRHREKSGRFRSVEELLVVRGISRKKLQVLRPYVVVEAKAEKKAEEED
jgi:competence protein ComEA